MYGRTENMNTYDLERIARKLVKKAGGDEQEAMRLMAPVVDQHDLTGDQILDLADMIIDVADGLPI